MFEIRRDLLRRAKELRKSVHDVHKFVYICPDSTPSQRDESKKLGEEL